MKRTILLFGVLAATGAGCATDPGETTAIGAATGSAIGAGVGALVGSQTGDAGTGLLLGAAAGSVAGAAVGNAFQAQDERFEDQEERQRRQEQGLALHDARIEELRRMGQDNVSFKGEGGAAPEVALGASGSDVAAGSGRPSRPDSALDRYKVGTSRSEASTGAGVGAYGSAGRPASSLKESDPIGGSAYNPRLVERAVREEDIDVPAVREEERAPKSLGLGAGTAASAAVGDGEGGVGLDGGLGSGRRAPLADARGGSGEPAPSAPVEVSSPSRASSLVTQKTEPAVGGGCDQAKGEMQKAEAVSETADKLFHYRRALRLCPENPAYHVSVGDIYVSLKRRADAEYEYKEALKINPAHGPALQKLQALKGS